MSKKINIKEMLPAFLSVMLLVIVDQFTKHLAIIKLKDNEPFVLIKNVFELRYLENRGAAFGIMQNQIMFFVIITLVMVIGILYLYFKCPSEKKYSPIKICMIFIIAGAFGNLIDRVFRGFVVDFFYFSLINFPIFNVADIYVTVSFFVLVLLLLFYYKEEELDMFFKKEERR